MKSTFLLHFSEKVEPTAEHVLTAQRRKTPLHVKSPCYKVADGNARASERLNICEQCVSPLSSKAATEEQTPNINVIHSVWRRLKKAKIRDLQPTKDVRGGGGVAGTSNPTTGGTGSAGNRAAVRNLAPVAAMIALALPNPACGTVIVNVHAVNAKNEPVPDSAPAVILLQGKTNLDKTMDGTMGVTIKQMYWTLGQYDQVCIFEAPDDETAAGVLLAADMLGNIRTQTMRAFTASEMEKILAKVP